MALPSKANPLRPPRSSSSSCATPEAGRRLRYGRARRPTWARRPSVRRAAHAVLARANGRSVAPAGPARPPTHPAPHPRCVSPPALGHTCGAQAIFPRSFAHFLADLEPPPISPAGAETKIGISSATTSSCSSLRREQPPRTAYGPASGGGRGARCPPSSATASVLPFPSGVVFGARSSTLHRPAAT